MNKRRLYYSACSLSVMVLSGALAPAAPATNSDPVALETVEVLGSREQAYRATVAPQINKSDTPLQEIPFSVQVVTRELIADRGALTLGEALRYTPGLAPQVGFSNSNDRFTIRGFTTPFSYTNGFRRSGYSVDTQLANLEQIEILKGSASALYGRAEPSGIVNIVTKKPQRDAFTEISVLAGDFEAFRAAIDTNQPLGDAFGFRLNASFDDRGSYRDLVESQSRFVAPVMSWSPTDATTVSLELEYSELRSFPDRGFGNSALFLQASRHRQFAGADALLERDGGSVTLSVDHRLSDRFSLRVAGQHSTFEINALIYNAGFPAVTGFPGTAPRVNVVPNDTYDKQRNTTGQVELYARFKTGEWGHQGLLGLEQGEDYWDYLFLRTATVSLNFDNPEVPGPATGPFSVNFGGQEKARASAAYFQNEMARGSWRFLIGGRYDWSEASVCSYGFGAPSFNERSEGRFSPRVGVTWTPQEEVSFYLSFAESFSPQPIRLRSGVADSVRGESIEAGVKLSWLNDRLKPTIAVFEIERFNAAVSDPNDPPFSIVVGRSRSRGLEIEVPATFTQRWRGIINYTYLDTGVVRDPLIPVGTPLVNAPEHSASLWTSYDFDGAWDGVTAGVGVLHIGERAATSTDTIRIPGYTRIDMSLGYGFDTVIGRVKTQLTIQNVGSEFYYDSGGSFLPVFPGAPRTVTFSASVRF